ncbi:hypothetical protein AMTRI_Chr10g224850 [Amborella trichopoda]
MRLELCRASWLRRVPTPCSNDSSPCTFVMSSMSFSSAWGIELSMDSQSAPIWFRSLDLSGAITGPILGMGFCGFQDTLVVVIGVDEGDGEAVLDHAVRELHHGCNVALGRVADHQCMGLAHISLLLLLLLL